MTQVNEDGEIVRGNIKRGAMIFRKQCANCHTIKENGEHLAGPNLWNVFNNPAGRHHKNKTFKKHSQNFKLLNVKFTQTNLQSFLKNPKKLFPGCTMIWDPNRLNESQREDVIAYMATKTNAYREFNKIRKEQTNVTDYANTQIRN